MTLDLTTLMTMESFVAVCAGVVLLIAWAQNWKILALAIWGAANIVAGCGVFLLMLGKALNEPPWSIVGGVLLALAPGLMWKASRKLDEQPAPLALALLGMGVVALASVLPAVENTAGLISLSAGAMYLSAAATSLWNCHNEPLPARWPLALLAVLHAAVLSIGALSIIVGSVDQNAVPPVASLFGCIHFESVIFTVGSTVFILGLVKERDEAASKAAAEIDPLTGIVNRGAFMKRGERIVERCRHEGAPVSVMMFDLDRFKAVNDAHGHAIGDAVIRKFCESASAMLRPIDLFGRIGGEEFAVVLPGSGIEAAIVRAERIRTFFEDACQIVAGCQVNGTVSGGVATSPKCEQALLSLLESSDAALYRAKANGRNCIKRAESLGAESGSSNVLRVA